MNHHTILKNVLRLAAQGRGSVHPNPMVGATVLKDARIIGKGYHRIYGGVHAEADALNHCSESPREATLYCNLEPCCFRHKNKHQPPCTERIIAEGITKVVLANLDPNPLVNGQGVQQLRDAGIEVIVGVMQREGQELNAEFFNRVSNFPPFPLEGKLEEEQKAESDSPEQKEALRCSQV
jgi:diaminohydroxyphosphoribosylaminopyrimidine deaminase/5-amino-6-(5-phosphoribosylamino)uracil reductase